MSRSGQQGEATRERSVLETHVEVVNALWVCVLAEIRAGQLGCLLRRDQLSALKVLACRERSSFRIY